MFYWIYVSWASGPINSINSLTLHTLTTGNCCIPRGTRCTSIKSDNRHSHQWPAGSRLFLIAGCSKWQRIAMSFSTHCALFTAQHSSKNLFGWSSTVFADSSAALWPWSHEAVPSAILPHLCLLQLSHKPWLQDYLGCYLPASLLALTTVTTYLLK